MSISENVKVENGLMASVMSPFTKFHQEAGRQVLHQKISFPSATNSSWQSTVYPPSSSTLIDRRMYLRAVVQVSSASLEDGALRAFPLASLMQSLTISVNGSSVTSQPKDLVYFRQRCDNDEEFRARYLSGAPCLPDPANSYKKSPQAYSFTVTGGGGGTYIVPNASSPFVDEFAFASTCEHSRAAFPKLAEVAGTSVTYELFEPLLHGLCEEGDDALALTNVRELSISINWDSSLRRIWSRPADAILGDLAVNLVVQTPELHICYVEPSDASKIPLQVSIPVVHHQVKSTPVGTITAAETKTVSFNNIIVGQMPRRAYIYARPNNATQNERVADGFCSIKRLSMTVGTRSGLLGSASPYQLYKMAVQNGVGMNWNQWSKRVGSVAVIDFANDIGGVTPGAIGNVAISFDVDLRNTFFNDAAINAETTVEPWSFDLYCVLELDGSYNIAQDSAQLSLGLSVADQLEVATEEPLDMGDVSMNGKGLMGGSMKGWRKFLRGVRRNLNKANDFAQKIATVMPNPMVQGAAKLLNSATDVANDLKIGQEPAGNGYRRGRGLLRM